MTLIKVLRKIYRETGLAVDSDTYSGSGCNKCEGACNCSDPSDNTSDPLDDEDATDGDDGGLNISLSLGEALDLSHVETAIVKKEPTDQTTQQSVHRPDTASTSIQGILTDVMPFKTKCIERKDPYICHVCLMEFELQSSYVKHMKDDHPDEALQAMLLLMDYLSTSDPTGT